jgi:hypothetical protein
MVYLNRDAQLVWSAVQPWAGLAAVGLLLTAPGMLRAQAANDPRHATELAFGPQQTVSAPSPQTSAAQPAVPTGVVTGKVTDEDGTPISGAVVVLTRPPSLTRVTATADANGDFRFEKVAPGAFTLSAAAPGLVSEGESALLAPGATLTVPPIELLTASTSSEVDVVASQHEIAQAELEVEEQQRLLGFLPNYYVVYNWHAAALSPGQKTELARKTLFDPVNLAIVALTAGIQQETGALSGYGYGFQGYGARLGANLANFASGTLIGGMILPVILKQDPRYFYRGTGSIRSRAGWALAQAVIARNDHGKWRPAYAGIGGDISSGYISNLYYPVANRTGSTLALENGLLAIGEDAIGNLVQEFLFKHLTPHTADYPASTPKTP